MKIIGAILVFISSSLLGLQNALKIKFHINDLKKICVALTILKSEIEFGASTLYEAAKIFLKTRTHLSMKYFRKLQNNLKKNQTVQKIFGSIQ